MLRCKYKSSQKSSELANGPHLRKFTSAFAGTDKIGKCFVGTMAGRKSLYQSSKIEGGQFQSEGEGARVTVKFVRLISSDVLLRKCNRVTAGY